MANREILAERSSKTIYRESDKVIKQFSRAYSKADILNEALNQARVEETDLNIPRIMGVGTNDGMWTIELEYIEGRTLKSLMDEFPEKRDEYLESFVALQTEIHKKTCPLLGHLRDKMHRKIDQSELDENTKYDLHTRLEGMKKHNKVLHGDFNPSNVIVKEDGSMYILDWSHATQGNASADAARTYLMFSLKGEDEIADKYLKLFSEKSGISIQNIQKWMPIVAASQSVKGNEVEKKFLLNWATVVEYE